MTKRTKFLTERPRRERLLVRAALQNMGLRYKEVVTVRNPYNHGWKGTRGPSFSKFDFCVWTGKKMVVLLFHPKYGNSGVKPHEWEWLEAKKRLLESKGIPYVVIRRNETSQTYGVIIRNFIRKEAYDQDSATKTSGADDGREP